MNKHRVFVYGTLREGFSSATHLLPGYMMLAYEGKDFKFPYIVPHRDWDVTGNVLEVSDSELEQLDKYENIRSGLYTREKVSIKDIESGGFIAAWAYIAGPVLFNVIESGDWLEFLNKEK